MIDPDRGMGSGLTRGIVQRTREPLMCFVGVLSREGGYRFGMVAGELLVTSRILELSLGGGGVSFYVDPYSRMDLLREFLLWCDRTARGLGGAWA